MASKSALFLVVNLICFVIAHGACPTPSPPPPPRSPPPPPRSPPPPKGSCPSPPPPPPPSSTTKCPKDALKFGVCADVLGLIKGVKLGSPPTSSCCSLLGGLVDLEAAVCLCTALKANILGISLNIPIDLSLILNYCGKGTPSGYTCS